MDADFYFRVLYPLQDQVLAAVRHQETGLYLAGGTAASRGYLHHRFSDDLDLFTNDDPRFRLWSERVLAGLVARPDWTVDVLMREAAGRARRVATLRSSAHIGSTCRGSFGT